MATNGSAPENELLRFPAEYDLKLLFSPDDEAYFDALMEQGDWVADEPAYGHHQHAQDDTEQDQPNPTEDLSHEIAWEDL